MNTKRVLVVDDDEDILAIVQANLESAGFNVTLAQSGKDGLRRAKRERPGLIVLDVLMPGIDGWEFLRQIEANPATAGTPVVMLTCKSENEDVLRGLEAGAVEYMTKPFFPEELVSRVSILLTVFDPRMRDERRRLLIEKRRRLMETDLPSLAS